MNFEMLVVLAERMEDGDDSEAAAMMLLLLFTEALYCQTKLRLFHDDCIVESKQIKIQTNVQSFWVTVSAL